VETDFRGEISAFVVCADGAVAEVSGVEMLVNAYEVKVCGWCLEMDTPPYSMPYSVGFEAE
jgi:hypothetical protein